MTSPDDRRLLDLAEHVTETRRRLEEGKAEIDRQRASVAETERHLSGVSRWIEQTARHLGEARSRRDQADADDLPPAA